MFFEKEVRAGAQFLDEQRPGWELKLNVGELDLNSCSQCVIGQLYGEYTMNIEGLTDSDQGRSELGFFVPYDMDTAWHAWYWAQEKFPDAKDGWAQLRLDWIELIKERLDAGISI